MAMNGVTMALANTGQEAVWQRVWRKHGMSDEQIRAYFTGPSFRDWATEQEWAWTSARQSYLAAPVGDSYADSAALCAKWSAR